MTKRAITQADFVDTRRVKGRKVLQIICEVPLEQEQRIMETLGWPNPATGLPVAIARLDPSVAKGGQSDTAPSPSVSDGGSDSPVQPKKRFSELPRSAQAALKCKDPEFQVWLAEKYKAAWDSAYYENDSHSETAAILVLKAALGIVSRKSLDSVERHAEAFDRILTDFDYRNSRR